MKPFVSVLVPALNEERYLRQSLASLLAQTHQRMEIIVLYDQASTDKTLALAQSFEPRLHVVSLPHMPISRALNEGLARTQGDLVFYAEADCLYNPQTIELAVKPFEDPGVGGVAILGRYYGVKGLWGKAQDEFQVIRDEWFLSGQRPLNWCYFYRRTVLEELKGFNENLLQGEDQFLAREIKARGYKIVCIRERLRQHAISGSINDPVKTATSSMRTAYLHAIQSFSPQSIRKRLLFLALLAAGAVFSWHYASPWPLALPPLLAYLYNFLKLLPVASRFSASTLFLAPFISMYKAFFYALGYLQGFLSRPFVSVSHESREHAGVPATGLKVLMFGKSKRGGFYYYTTLLEEALAKQGVQCTNNWRELFQADLVHYQFDDLFPLHRFKLLGFLFLARLFGKPVVVTAHNPVARRTRNPLKYLFYHLANRLIVHNETTWAFSSKASVIPHGNYCFYLAHASGLSKAELKRKWNSPYPYTVLSYGTIRRNRNYPLTLEILALLRQSGLDVGLLIAGNASEVKPTDCGLARLPDYVRLYCKYLSEAETHELFTLADAVLLTNSEHDHSGIPHIAHCFRKPVIAPQCLGHQTRFVASTKEQFVSLLREVLANPPNMERERKRELTDFDWQRIAASTAELYRSMVRKKEGAQPGSAGN